jgi:hypothetical protein
MNDATSDPAVRARRPRLRNGVVALLLFLGLVVAYHANRTVLDEGDAVPSINLPLAVLETGRLSFDPEHFPEMFKWKSHAPIIERDDFYFIGWNETWLGKTLREWQELGHLDFNGPRYYIIKSPRRPEYVSTFGPIPGLLLLPVMAPFYAFDHDIGAKLPLKTSVGKLEASLFVATCATLLFLIAARLTTRWRALLVALVYGLGTCAWSISSQNAWQQTENQLFLTLGTFFLLGDFEKTWVAGLSGFAFGAAVASRATSAAMFAAVLVFVFLRHRKSTLAFLVGSIPVPLAIGVYNYHYFGSPLVFAQELVGHVIAKEKTGSPDLWQTPIHRGLLGLLFSPSRGLLVFSPVLAASFLGARRIWQDPAYAAFRPLTVAVGFMMATQCMWFDWWGGWAYGYRPWLDVVPFLALFVLPAIPDITQTTQRKALFAAAFGWSVFVQALGALTYDRYWNMRTLYVVRLPNVAKPFGLPTEDAAERLATVGRGSYLGPTVCDIDLPFCRYRLWSIDDSVIWFYTTHYAESRARRMKPGWELLGSRE